MNRTSTILRDMLNVTFNSIHINDPALADDIRKYIREIAPEKEKIVKFIKALFRYLTILASISR